jgi:hypothetical protein
MISVTVYDGFAEVKIGGMDFVEFEKDLNRFKDSIDQKDREYKSHKQVWLVKNLKAYTRVPFIQQALLAREKQLNLF